MGKTQYYCAATLDGYIAEADDSIGWLLGYEGTYDDPEAEPGPMSGGGSYERFYDDVGALVSGSTTYEWVLDHISGDGWPYRISTSQLRPWASGKIALSFMELWIGVIAICTRCTRSYAL